MSTIKFNESPSFRKSASIDLDGFTYQETVGFRGATRTVKVTRAKLMFEWDFQAGKWRASVKLLGRWVLKDGSLGKDEHEAYSWRNEPQEFEKLRQSLLAEHTPRTIVTLTEVPADAQ